MIPHRLRLAICLLVLVAATHPVHADRVISSAALEDKLRGVWFGQNIGIQTGLSFEGFYNTREAAPDAAFLWINKTSAADPWRGDDAIDFEYLYLHAMETHGLAPTPADIRTEWDDHVPFSIIFIANLQAKLLMNAGRLPPETGAYRYNMHAYAIDSQITTDSLGAMTPGMRQQAVQLVRRFGVVSNQGFSLHASQYYAAMFAAAAFESDVDALVALGQQSIPQSSRTWRVIQDVRDWHAMDLLDNVPDWRETRRKIYDFYVGNSSQGRYRSWVESTVNVALSTLALLYGQGDFEATVRIATLSGFDADCNAAMAGGLLGMVHGFAGLPAALTGPATDVFLMTDLVNLNPNQTISGVAGRLRVIAEQMVAAHGGSVGGGLITLPDADPVLPDPELPDPVGPTGLVAAVRAAGGTVSASASVEWHLPWLDRYNLDAITDGIVDVSYNGHLPYFTQDGSDPQPPGGDYYQLNFSEPVRFDTLTFHEGDLLWHDINADPRMVEPDGGYFLNLLVEVHTPAGWALAQDLALSEPLDPFILYQVIDLTFSPTVGDKVRIRGDAGGRRQCTTIVELTARGARLGDFDENGRIEPPDITGFVGVLLGMAMDPRSMLSADLNLDGRANGADIPPFITALGGG